MPRIHQLESKVERVTEDGTLASERNVLKDRIGGLEKTDRAPPQKG